jgi:hypothetical protein
MSSRGFSESFLEERLKLLKKSAQKLRQKKREGFDPQREYEIGEILYSKAEDRFGRVVECRRDRFLVDFGTKTSVLRRTIKTEESSQQEAISTTETDDAGAIVVYEYPESELGTVDESGDDVRFKWTPEKDCFIRDNLNRSNQWLAEKLQTTVASVKGRTHRLKESGFIDANTCRNFVWEEDQDQFLVAHIHESNRWLAEQLDTTVGSVKGRIRRLRERGVIVRGERRSSE